MKTIALLVFIWIIAFDSFAQNNGEQAVMQEMSFSAFLNGLENENGSIFSLKNTVVKFDKVENERYSLFEYKYEDKPYPADVVHVNKTINLDNVRFENVNNVQNFGLVNFHFHKPINLKNTFSVFVYNCEFDSDFAYRNTIASKQNRANTLLIKDCMFNSKVLIQDYSENEKNVINLTNNEFGHLGSGDYTEFETNPLLIISISKLYVFIFNNNELKYDNATFSIQIFDIKEAFFSKNKIQSNNWNYLFINNIQTLSLIHNAIETDLLFGIDKLKSEYTLQWPISAHKVMPVNYIFSNSQKIEKVSNEKLSALYGDNKVSDEFYYKYELTHLSKFHSYFKEFHDRQSANDVYLKIKDLETERLEYLYSENETFENYFELTVNRFLKRFSNYGTSPSKIVKSSFHIILIFAFLFLFSSNSWNKLNLSRFNKGIEQSIHYFTTDNNIVKAFEIDEERLAENSKTKVLLTERKAKVPLIFSMFSVFYINLQIKLSQLKQNSWNKVDFVKGNWSDLQPFKKGLYSALIFVLVGLYLLLKLSSILLNSLTLSINSFTTLGFGEIPITGLGRYLAIIEGFVGWVFLTLFSVTLISQILS